MKKRRRKYLYLPSLIVQVVKEDMNVKTNIIHVLQILVILILTMLISSCSYRQEEISITIVGDIMLSRGVQSFLDSEGYDYPYTDLKEILINDDLSLANLECPITDSNTAAGKPGRFVFKADKDNAEALKRAGFELLNLANNHTMDYKYEGLEDTMSALSEVDLAYFGAGQSASENMSYIYQKYGIRIGFLAYSLFPPEGFVYNAGKSTVNYMSESELDQMKIELDNLDADIKIVYFHWGIEFEPYVSEIQKKAGRLAIDYGADFVVGTHPHVIQPKEVYKNRYIYYSLGNCIFDKQIPKGTDQGLLLRLKVDKEGIKSVEEEEFRIVRARVVRE